MPGQVLGLGGAVQAHAHSNLAWANRPFLSPLSLSLFFPLSSFPLSLPLSPVFVVAIVIRRFSLPHQLVPSLFFLSIPPPPSTTTPARFTQWRVSIELDQHSPSLHSTCRLPMEPKRWSVPVLEFLNANNRAWSMLSAWSSSSAYLAPKLRGNCARISSLFANSKLTKSLFLESLLLMLQSNRRSRCCK